MFKQSTVLCLLAGSVGLLSACQHELVSQQIAPRTTQVEPAYFAELDAEYGTFTTQALTQGYLKSKVQRWADEGAGERMRREIEYARFKHPNTLKAIMCAYPDLYDTAAEMDEIQEYISESTLFADYMDELSQNCQPPDSPTALDGTEIGPEGFTAHWQSVQDAVGYRVILNGQPTDVGNVLSYEFNGLDPATLYSYRIQAYNDYGNSALSNIIQVTTESDVPGAPTALAASDVTSSSFTANWQALPEVTGYKLQIDDDEPIDLGDVTSYVVNNLDSSTEYTYRLIAYNAQGDGPVSNTVEVTTSVQLGASLFQSIITPTYHSEAFALNGEQYLFSLYNAELYKYNNVSNTFEIHQAITPIEGYDSQFFEFEGQHYLAFSNRSGHTIEVYKWNTGTQEFESFKSLAQNNAYGVEVFTVAGDLFLFAGGVFSPSTLYKWDSGSQDFVVFQENLQQATAPEHVVIGSDHYLSVQSYDGFALYKRNTVSGELEEVQSLSMGSNILVASTMFERNGSTYLTLSSASLAELRVYKWDTGSQQFTLLQTLADYASAINLNTAEVDGQFYLAALNHTAGVVFYRWNTGNENFEPLEDYDFMTSGGYHTQFFNFNSKTYLGVSYFLGSELNLYQVEFE